MSAIRRDETHAYFVDDHRVPISVTGVLKQAGLIDFSDIPPLVLGEALERGRIVHAAIHAFNERDLDMAHFQRTFGQYCGYLDGWISFCEQRKFVAVLNEHFVYSRRHDVAGAIDCLGTLDGIAVCLDFASGRASDVCKWLQTAAYEAFAREWASEDPALATFFAEHPFVKRYAVELKRNGSFRLEAYTSPSDYREFVTLLTAQAIVRKYRGERVEVAA